MIFEYLSWGIVCAGWQDNNHQLSSGYSNHHLIWIVMESIQNDKGWIIYRQHGHDVLMPWCLVMAVIWWEYLQATFARSVHQHCHVHRLGRWDTLLRPKIQPISFQLIKPLHPGVANDSSSEQQAKMFSTHLSPWHMLVFSSSMELPQPSTFKHYWLWLFVTRLTINP